MGTQSNTQNNTASYLTTPGGSILGNGNGMMIFSQTQQALPRSENNFNEDEEAYRKRLKERLEATTKLQDIQNTDLTQDKLLRNHAHASTGLLREVSAVSLPGPSEPIIPERLLKTDQNESLSQISHMSRNENLRIPSNSNERGNTNNG